MNKNLTKEYWFDVVDQIARASTCRVKIGAVIIENNRIKGVGYLGAISKRKHCDVYGCLFVDAPHQGSDERSESCVRTIHAETNAVIDCLMKTQGLLKHGVCYSTYAPCLSCFKLLVQIGVKEIYYRKMYRDAWRDALIQDDNFTDIKMEPFA